MFWDVLVFGCVPSERDATLDITVELIQEHRQTLLAKILKLAVLESRYISLIDAEDGKRWEVPTLQHPHSLQRHPHPSPHQHELVCPVM